MMVLVHQISFEELRGYGFSVILWACMFIKKIALFIFHMKILKRKVTVTESRLKIVIGY